MKHVVCAIFIAALSQLARNADGSEAKPIPFTLGMVRQLKLHVSDKDSVTKLFGRPKEVSQLTNIPGRKGTVELWEYFEGGSTRLSVSFASENDFVDSWTWHVSAGDPEKKLGFALKKFRGASWVGETEKWINPHHDPVTCFYKDKKVGVTVRYNEFRKEVESISVLDPARELAASTADEKPPKFCIGDACVDGIPAKEWAKTGPTCEVPK